MPTQPWWVQYQSINYNELTVSQVSIVSNEPLPEAQEDSPIIIDDEDGIPVSTDKWFDFTLTLHRILSLSYSHLESMTLLLIGDLSLLVMIILVIQCL